MSVDFEELAAFLELLQQLEFSHFRFEKGDLRIEVHRGSFQSAPSVPDSIPSMHNRSAAASPGSSSRKYPASAEVADAAPGPPDSAVSSDDHVVRAPLLGTFYSAPKPGELPFVKIGAAVEPNSPVCVIEVMKLFNSVVAGAAGTVTAILARDGQLVEYDQPLFTIRVKP